MSVTNVYHKSREHSITLNFPATESSLSWALTAESDGEIFAIELDNVASYTIDSNSVFVPFTLIAGQSYLVEILKTNNGVESSITLKTRRAVNKFSELIVPDFGFYDGRYSFALTDNQKIVKYDNDLFIPSNFSDFNTTLISPKISTYTLPSNDCTLRTIKFVTIGAVEYLLIIGAVNYNGGITPFNERGFKAILFRISDNTFWSVDRSLENQWSFYQKDVRVISNYSCTYNYVENTVFYTDYNGVNGIKINLIDGSFDFLQGSTLSHFSYNLTKQGCGFDPVNNLYAGKEIIFDEQKVSGFISGDFGLGTAPVYDRKTLKWVKSPSQVNVFSFYNYSGQLDSNISVTNLNSRHPTPLYIEGEYICNLGGGTGQKMFAVLDLNTLTGFSYTITKTINGLTFNGGCASNRNQIFISTMIDAIFVYEADRQKDRNEIILINPKSPADPVYGRYLEAEGNIVSLVSNQYI